MTFKFLFWDNYSGYWDCLLSDEKIQSFILLGQHIVNAVYLYFVFTNKSKNALLVPRYIVMFSLAKGLKAVFKDKYSLKREVRQVYHLLMWVCNFISFESLEPFHLCLKFNNICIYADNSIISNCIWSCCFG